MDYSFNTQTGVLDSRKNHSFNWLENFTYDNLNRLTNIGGAVTYTQNYDTRGRITDNTAIGQYNYNTSNKYRLNDISLNTQGDIYYQNHSLQQIKYNAFKKPVDIFEEGKGRVSFEYSPMGNRSHAYYGGLNEDKLQRNFIKHYSTITSVEIIEDKVNNTTKIITYIGGDAYSAPIVHIKNTKVGSSNGYHYLHRDYLGSILAITDAVGVIKEQRQFGAWGVVDKFVDSKGNTIFDDSSLISRGYTGHEHFFEVGLIHMNGRMYDAKLGRFLSPDNFIQDPFSTQSYNRFGYVWNNPLIYNDFSGELSWKSIGRWLENNWKQVVTIAAVVVVTVAVTVLTAGTATPFLIGVYSGAAGGFTGGVLGTALNGGNFADSLMNGLIGLGTGALFMGLGSYAASFAPAGILNGALYGGSTNAALGGLADLAMGGDGVQGALWGGFLGLVSGGYTGFAKAKALGANMWTGKTNLDQGKYPGSFINNTKPGVNGSPNSKIQYTTQNGKPLSNYYYNEQGLLEFQLDYKPHNMGFPHGHQFTIPGNFPSGHLPQNHVPFIKIPLKFFKL